MKNEMKLAYQLTTMVELKLHVIDNIKTRMTKHLRDVASRGATWCNFQFLSEDREVKDEILVWLRKEGFAVIVKDEQNLHLSWDKEMPNIDIEHRVRLAITRARRGKCLHVIFKPDIMDTDTDLRITFGKLRDQGYQVQSEESSREATISWKPA